MFASCVIITTVPYFDMVYYSGLYLQLYTDTAVADLYYDYYALHYRQPITHFIHQSLGMQSIFGLEQNIWSMYALVSQRNVRIIGEVVWKPKQTTANDTTVTPTATPIVYHFTSPEWSAASTTTGRTSVSSVFSKKRKFRQVLFWNAVHWEQMIQYTVCRRWAKQAIELVLANNNNNNTNNNTWEYEIDYVALKQRTIMLSNPSTTTVTNNNDDYDDDDDDDDDDDGIDTVEEHPQQQRLSSSSISSTWWSLFSLSFNEIAEWLFEPVDSENKFHLFFEDLLYVYRPNHHTRIEEGDGTYEVNQQLVDADDTELNVNVNVNVNVNNGKDERRTRRGGWDKTNDGVWWDQRYYQFNSERREFILDRSKTTTAETTTQHVVVGNNAKAYDEDEELDDDDDNDDETFGSYNDDNDDGDDDDETFVGYDDDDDDDDDDYEEKEWQEFLLDRSKTTTAETTKQHVVVGDNAHAYGGDDVPRNVNDKDNHNARKRIEDPNNSNQQEEEEVGEEEEEEEQYMNDDDQQQYDEL